MIQCNLRDISARAKGDETSRTYLTALEMTSTTRDGILAALSHELRTPLTDISSMLDALELEHKLVKMSDSQAVPELDDSGLAFIRRNVQTLAGVVDQLLDLTQISRGDIQVELATMDAHQAIGDALREAAAKIKEKRIDLRVNLRAEFRHIPAVGQDFARSSAA